ncbi:hypothetical protein [Emticicia sp. W12TSBA100-4]|uniref:hypothetical protein n=1 Tax=Emticicia sp. W12TSBA100-4 TaxID=3160965 RepID=UPI0033063125
MNTTQILFEIDKLPRQTKMFVVEKVLHSIRQQEQKEAMKKAAEILYEDYLTDNELTAFTNLDSEGFYESK